MLAFLFKPWPWYVAGPLLGLFVPALLFVGNRSFGVSSNLRHLCAACLPSRTQFFKYDWRSAGLWNLVFLAGTVVGGFIGGRLLGGSGVPLVPPEVFTWAGLLTPRGLVLIVGGGFLVGFGTAYAGGCTSGHGIAGLADRQLPSLIAVMGFFAGGLLATYVILPRVLR